MECNSSKWNPMRALATWMNTCAENQHHYKGPVNYSFVVFSAACDWTNSRVAGEFIINTLTTERCDCNLKLFTYIKDRFRKHFLWNCPWANSETPHWATLVQAMAWCRLEWKWLEPCSRCVAVALYWISFYIGITRVGSTVSNLTWWLEPT